MFLMDVIKSGMASMPRSLSSEINALPIIAPELYVVATENVLALLMPNPTICGFLRFICSIRLK